MMLFRKNLVYRFRLFKPQLSQLKSLADLQAMAQKRLLVYINKLNTQKFESHMLKPLHQKIQQKLCVDEKSAKQMSNRSIPITLHNKNVTRQSEYYLESGDIEPSPNPSDYTYSFPTKKINTHFTYKRGISTANELYDYQFDGKTVYLVNLPQNISKEDIKIQLKDVKVEFISFVYSILGLPAIAKIQFTTFQQYDKFIAKKQRKFQFGDRIAFIKTEEQKQKLKKGNRQLFIEIPQDCDLSQLVINLNDHGKVLNIDYPMQVSRNPTMYDIKKNYQNSNMLIRINTHYKDGTVESQYYPQKKLLQEDEVSHELQSQERLQRLSQVYENRTRFATPIDVYDGEENQLTIKPKGYCVVTYSSYEQCQSYYLKNSYTQKISLMGDKYEFELDKQYKKQILRSIDNAYLIKSKSNYEKGAENRNFQEYQKQHNDIYDLLDLFEVRYDAYTEDPQFDEQNQTYTEQANEYRKFIQQNYGIKKFKGKLDNLSFEQMAQKQLFGRILPKTQVNQTLHIQTEKMERSQRDRFAHKNNLMETLEELAERDIMLERQIERSADSQTLKKIKQIEKQKQKPVKDIVFEESIKELGKVVKKFQKNKRSFSTKKVNKIFRKRTPQEQASYWVRFDHFIRKTIFEYLGIFSDKDLEKSAFIDSMTYLNPRKLSFTTGQDFLVENDLENVFQFRSNIKQAQKEYELYFYESQMFKSKNISVPQLLECYQQTQKQILRKCMDYGVVKDSYELKSEDSNFQQKVRVLNGVQAKIGQQYKLQTQNDQKHLVKVAKIENIYPLHKAQIFDQFIVQNGNDINQQQSNIFQKHFSEMWKTGIINDEVCDIFGVKKGLTLDDLLIEVGSNANIFKKDLQIMMNSKKYTEQQITKDIEDQIKLEQVRQPKRKVRYEDFGKDPSTIGVRNRQGYFRVSRFKQI